MSEKQITDLALPAEFDEMPVHLMTRQSNPPTKPVTVVQVGYNQHATETVEWFDVNGSVARAQEVIDAQVVPAIRDYLEVAPPLPEPAESEMDPAKPLTAAQVKAANARTAKAASARTAKA